MLNQTTNTRYSKHRKANASEQAIAQLAEYELSEEEDEDESSFHQPTPATTHTRLSRVSSLDGSANAGCTSNCTNMFCGPGHFRKQERIMRKYIHPEANTNQEGVSSSGNNFQGQTAGANMSDSYAKRQMFHYVVPDLQ